MKHCVMGLAAAMLLFTGGAKAAESIVPIDEEPQHRLRFQNQHVRLFDVLLPPGYKSLWHYHMYDGVFVNIEAAPTSEQVLGADASERPPRIIGETYFFGYGKKPKVHRVSNSGASNYRVTDTEILQACGGFVPPKDGEGQTLILDNERVRVTRIMIAPGEHLSLHPPCGMLVSVNGGRLTVSGAGAEEQIALQPAGFKWRDQAAPLEIVNAGNEVFHGVDIVIK
jgi:beta-alanine degradation protein BauB